ncbi:hypothetical protein CYA_2261 [Synechococcus sp. JA-3-3Ab]|nr:hypothetical protein CYA_2261 [Synechococcus sp. JA-3-3Ab]
MQVKAGWVAARLHPLVAVELLALLEAQALVSL